MRRVPVVLFVLLLPLDGRADKPEPAPLPVRCDVASTWFRLVADDRTAEARDWERTTLAKGKEIRDEIVNRRLQIDPNKPWRDASHAASSTAVSCSATVASGFRPLVVVVGYEVEAARWLVRDADFQEP